MAKTGNITPQTDQLWLSKPPHLMIARVRSVDLYEDPPTIEYQLLDDDGLPLTPRVSAVLDSTWWANFQPLVRRQG